MLNDETAGVRKDFVAQNTAAVESDSVQHEMIRLQEIHGEHNVWTTDQMREQFDPVAFAAPFMECRRKSDGAHGWLEFQHAPRLYFNFRLD